MQNIVTKLFEAGLLSEADKVALQEGFEARVNEAVEQERSKIEESIRGEMAQRYEHDKNTLIEAMELTLTDVVQKHEASRAEDTAKLKEAQARFESARGELQARYKTRLKEHAQVLESFVMQKLSSELGEFNEDAKAVSEMRVRYASALAECKQAYKARVKEHVSTMQKFVLEKLNAEVQALRSERSALAEERAALKEATRATQAKLDEDYANRIAKIDKFVVTKVAQELREFQEDKRALVDKQVQLVAESRQKLAETQRSFVARAAKLVDQKVSESLKVELKQLHEDLERNRQNMFGRRIFEAMAAEFMTSYFSEGTEVKKLEKVLESERAEKADLAKALTESKQATEAAVRRIKLAEAAAARTKVMGELLAPLSHDKRTVMKELLESVKTEKLRESFTKYLPSVIGNGEGKKVASNARQTLAESKVVVKKDSCVAITGDQRNNRLMESVKAEDDLVSKETAEILKLAGLRKSQ